MKQAFKLLTILVIGNFNVVHPGHLRLLRFAKEYGNRLVVAVQSDRLAGKAAHVPEQLRLEGIRSINLVDEAFIADESPIDTIARLRPDIVVKGKEHELIFNPELTELEKYGGRLVFSSGEALFSSLDLISKEFKANDFRSISLPQEYFARHAIDIGRLTALIDNFSKIRVCVIGDLIVDEYISCQPLGMSQEDPTIVVTPVNKELFIGGAAIVAAHAAGMGAKVEFIAVTGSDDAQKFAQGQLDAANVSSFLIIDDSRPTTLKQRFRSKGKTLLRVSHMHQEPISINLQNKLIERVAKIIGDVDLLVFSDFNYGCLPQPLVDKIYKIAKENRIKLAADSQSSSQIGDIARFKGMDLLTPTEHEARLAMRNREDGLVVLAEKLRQLSDARNVLLKLGEDGLLIHSGGSSGKWITDRISALNAAPKDVAGAGDSLLIVSALALASGADIWEAAVLGSFAAAVQVGRIGNTPLNAKEFLRELHK
jgi:rfaE bifunctional protein kinase chain/domain